MVRLPAGSFGLLLWIRFLDESFGFLPAGALEPIRRDLDLGYTALSLMIVAPFATSLPAVWFTARTDRGDPRGVVVGGGFLTAIALGLFAASTGAVMLVAAGALWGFGASLLVHGAELALVRQAGDDLHRRLRVVNLLGTVGDVLGPLLLVAVLAVGWSWRMAFVVAAVVSALYGLAALRLPPSAAVAEADDAEETPAWRDPLAWRLGGLAFLLMPFDETWLAFAIAFLQVERGLSASVATGFGIVAVVGAFAGFGPIARWCEHVPRRSMFALGGVAIGLAAGGVTVLPTWAVFAAGVVVNAGTAALWVTLQHAAFTLRPNAPGRTMALVVAVEHTTFVVPLGFGVLADHLGVGSVFTVYLVLGALLLLTAPGGHPSPSRSPQLPQPP